MNAAIANRLVKFVQGQVGLRRNQFSNQGLMPFKGIGLLASRTRRNRTRAMESLHQLDHTTHADRELSRRRIPRNSALNRRHDPTT
jgi:hypothetical protein